MSALESNTSTKPEPSARNEKIGPRDWCQTHGPTQSCLNHGDVDHLELSAPGAPRHHRHQPVDERRASPCPCRGRWEGVPSSHRTARQVFENPPAFLLFPPPSLCTLTQEEESYLDNFVVCLVPTQTNATPPDQQQRQEQILWLKKQKVTATSNRIRKEQPIRRNNPILSPAWGVQRSNLSGRRGRSLLFFFDAAVGFPRIPEAPTGRSRLASRALPLSLLAPCP